MIVIVFRYLLPKGFRGITLYPFVFLANEKDSSNEVLLNHEKIHIRQQLEMAVVFFFIWYGIEYLILLLKYKDRFLAYRNISFEREAYKNEKDLDYLQQRSFWNFYKYL
ncbi:hypothetical protein NHF50_10425 [Flavobacterium sp. NRK F10]|uniref:hypothetical protein n=1 Tax=Flavobacterium sp. NRK F10 TaxID=2954931 RepID=UPI00209156BE|nr:hypothetical protein [Flavobacterium sp. NRK F10]MCO6175458.1 hypothetical protein [Flavobacterium sp. NRK F10]